MNTKLNNCRLCHSTNVEERITRDMLPLYIWPLKKGEIARLLSLNLYCCKECGFIQIQNISKSMISEIYLDDVYNIDDIKLKKERYHLLKNNKFENSIAMEIGGGRNSFLGLLPINCEKWVSDFNVNDDVKNSVDFVFEGDFIDIDTKGGYFDYVFMFHVLEHLEDPGKALKLVRKIIKSSGKLVIEVPNFTFELNEIPYYTLFHMHISLFTEKTLIALLKFNGFELKKFFLKNNVLLAEFSPLKLDNYNKSSVWDEIQRESLACIDTLKNNYTSYYADLYVYFKNISNVNIAIFGAGGMTTLFLYNFPFLIDKILYAIDNDTRKQGKYICNEKIKVISPSSLECIDCIVFLNKSHKEYLSYNNKQVILISEVILQNSQMLET